MSRTSTLDLELGAEALRANLRTLASAAEGRTLRIELTPLGRHVVSIDGEQLAEASGLEVAALVAVRSAEARLW